MIVIKTGADAPVVESTACALAREVMSPEAITGTSTIETSSAVSEWSALPVLKPESVREH